ncbi:MAG TPA: HAD-IIA family hydrolase [Chloroflexota bacterium]|nr:HAD-IIA family hydrolase [Chloroflexota bacterium]
MERPCVAMFDVNGTLVLGGEAIPGAAAALTALSRRLRVCYFSNDPRGAEAIGARLLEAGFPVEPGAVLSAIQVAASRVGRRYAGQRVLTIAGAGLREALRAEGVEVVDEPPAAAVIVSGARLFTPEALTVACEAIWHHGAKLYASSLDRRVPYGPGRFAPGTGAVAQALAWATGATPEVLGKPSPLAVEAALGLLGAPPGAAVVVGDSLGEDVVLGQRLGARTALVLSGVATREHVAALAPDQRPDLVLDSVSNGLVEWIESLCAD